MALRYSTIFRQNINLLKYEEALWAINTNPCYDQRMPLVRCMSNNNMPLPSLIRQHECLVTTLSALQLVQTDNQYVVHKCHYFSNPKKSEKKGSILIRDTNDIKKEVTLMQAKMKLAEKSQDLLPICKHQPEEVVSLFCHSGYYDDARMLSNKFNLKLKPVFQSMPLDEFIRHTSVGTRWWNGLLGTSPSPWQSNWSTITWNPVSMRGCYWSTTYECDLRAVLDVLLGFRCSLPS